MPCATNVVYARWRLYWEAPAAFGIMMQVVEVWESLAQPLVVDMATGRLNRPHLAANPVQYLHLWAMNFQTTLPPTRAAMVDPDFPCSL